MDLFTLMIAIVLMMIALTSGQTWILLGTVLLVSLGTKSLPTTITLIIASIALFYSQDILGDSWYIALFGLLILALILGFKTEEGAGAAGGEYYAPDMGGLAGGGGSGLGGLGGY